MADEYGDDEFPVEVTNVHTGETTIYVVTAADLIDGEHCTGPCECPIEFDGVCEEGWPGTDDAVARLG